MRSEAERYSARNQNRFPESSASGDCQHLMENPIVILGDALQGGAANSTGRLVQNLVEQGMPIERWHFSARPSDAPAHYRSLDDRTKRPPLERILKNISRPWADRLRRKRHKTALEKAINLHSPALINVRNIHDCGLDHDSLRAIPHTTPLVWTMHDGWPFDQHAFTWSVCGSTEHAASDRPGAVERRHHFFEDRPHMVLISPSKWLAQEAKKKVPESVRVEVIPNGITTDAFKASQKHEAKMKIGLDPRRVWIGFASTWANSRKGVDLLPSAFHRLNLEALGLICWGGKPPLDDFPSNLPIHYAGHLKDQNQIASLYVAADLFLCPSRADNLPNTVLESMACGTPVIGSQVGGIPDMVRPGQTGWLHESDSASALALAIQYALESKDQWPNYQTTARAVAVNEFDIAINARRYRSLFEELIGAD